MNRMHDKNLARIELLASTWSSHVMSPVSILPPIRPLITNVTQRAILARGTDGSVIHALQRVERACRRPRWRKAGCTERQLGTTGNGRSGGQRWAVSGARPRRRGSRLRELLLVFGIDRRSGPTPDSASFTITETTLPKKRLRRLASRGKSVFQIERFIGVVCRNVVPGLDPGQQTDA